MDYLDAIAEGRDATDLAEAGTPAFHYATYIYQSTLAYGGGEEPATRTVDDNGITYRFNDGYEVRFDNLTVSPAGVTGFDVNGHPLAQRLVMAENPLTEVNGVEVGYVLAYHTVAGTLVTAIEIRDNNQTDLHVAGWEAQWVTSGDNRQYQAVESSGAAEIRPGAIGVTFMNFGDVGIETVDGTLYLDAFSNDFTRETSLQIPLTIATP